MARLRELIAETQRWRAIHMAAYRAGKKERSIHAAACAIREQALRDALMAVKRERGE